MMNATQVSENVWVGDWHDARDYYQMFDVVVNVALDAPACVGAIHFLIVDGPGNEPEILHKAVECVSEAILANKKVLVHCMAGRSRSVAITSAALYIARGLPFEDTVKRICLLRLSEPHQPEKALLDIVRP